VDTGSRRGLRAGPVDTPPVEHGDDDLLVEVDDDGDVPALPELAVPVAVGLDVDELRFETARAISESGWRRFGGAPLDLSG